MFKYAYESDLIDRPVKFGSGFSAPSAAVKRKDKANSDQLHGKRLFQPDEILMLLKTPHDWLRAAILLGINGGFGNHDCATLPLSAIDLKSQIVEYSRPKTGIRRITPLWPETADALQKAISSRPRPACEAAKNLALLLPTGQPLVRLIVTPPSGAKTDKISRLDLLSREFTGLLKNNRLHRKRVGFYSLRHTFRTWADETRDQHAIHLVMGHSIPGMSGVYVEEISLDRLRAVTKHVRSKLFPDPEIQSPIKSS